MQDQTSGEEETGTDKSPLRATIIEHCNRYGPVWSPERCRRRRQGSVSGTQRLGYRRAFSLGELELHVLPS